MYALQDFRGQPSFESGAQRCRSLGAPRKDKQTCLHTTFCLPVVAAKNYSTTEVVGFWPGCTWVRQGVSSGLAFNQVAQGVARRPTEAAVEVVHDFGRTWALKTRMSTRPSRGPEAGFFGNMPDEGTSSHRKALTSQGCIITFILTNTPLYLVSVLVRTFWAVKACHHKMWARQVPPVCHIFALLRFSRLGEAWRSCSCSVRSWAVGPCTSARLGDSMAARLRLSQRCGATLWYYCERPISV